MSPKRDRGPHKLPVDNVRLVIEPGVGHSAGAQVEAAGVLAHFDVHDDMAILKEQRKAAEERALPRQGPKDTAKP